MKLAVLTICLILIGINLLAWGLSGGQVAIDLRTGLAALCLNSYFFLFLLLGYAPLQRALGDWFGRSVGRMLAAVPVLLDSLLHLRRGHRQPASRAASHARALPVGPYSDCPVNPKAFQSVALAGMAGGPGAVASPGLRPDEGSLDLARRRLGLWNERAGRNLPGGILRGLPAGAGWSGLSVALAGGGLAGGRRVFCAVRPGGHRAGSPDRVPPARRELCLTRRPPGDGAGDFHFHRHSRGTAVPGHHSKTCWKKRSAAPPWPWGWRLSSSEPPISTTVPAPTGATSCWPPWPDWSTAGPTPEPAT